MLGTWTFCRYFFESKIAGLNWNIILPQFLTKNKGFNPQKRCAQSFVAAGLAGVDKEAHGTVYSQVRHAAGKLQAQGQSGKTVLV
jgi:hypothetical protein